MFLPVFQNIDSFPYRDFSFNCNTGICFRAFLFNQRGKQHAGSLFSTNALWASYVYCSLFPPKMNLLISWLPTSTFILIGGYSHVCPIALQLVSIHSFPLPRLKMTERRFKARKAFCGSQVRNISCIMADIWKASKYRRFDLHSDSVSQLVNK